MDDENYENQFGGLTIFIIKFFMEVILTDEQKKHYQMKKSLSQEDINYIKYNIGNITKKQICKKLITW